MPPHNPSNIFLKNMTIFIVTDIFGRTDCLDQLIEDLEIDKESVQIIDPYNGRERSFSNENDAYSAFVAECGMQHYAATVSRIITEDRSGDNYAIGFSVGASALWIASGRPDAMLLKKCICFYSSQIRNYPEVEPNTEIDIYFAATEPAYDVAELITTLSHKPGVHCFTTAHLHGFMNRKSVNFSQAGYNHYLTLVKKSLSNTP